MTKKRLAENLLSLVDNYRSSGESDETIIDEIGNFLDPLKPKDRESFAKWGYPEDKSTPEECWD